MAYGNVSVDTVTTSSPGGVLGAGNASIMKNRIINGAMVIDQRNAGASGSATGVFPVDRFEYSATQASKVTWQQNAGSVTPPVGFTKYLGFTSTSAYSVLSTDIFKVRQQIEGFNIADLAWGTANAKTVTLSAWVYSSLTGTFGGALLNQAENRSYPFTYSIPIANTWTQISVTIAGDTSGTWATDNTIGIRVSFSLGMGSTYSGTAGAWAAGRYESVTGATSVVGTNGATFYITGVQLEVGSSATGFEYRQYQQELALCMRYYEKSYDISYQPGINTSNGEIIFAGSTNQSGNIQLPIVFKVPKRTAPTIVGYTESGTSGQWGYNINGTSGNATFNSGATGENSTRVYVATGSNWAAANTAGHYTASAEL